MPVYGTIASQFNDPGANRLYAVLVKLLRDRCGVQWTSTVDLPVGESEKIYIIPPERSRYLSEIVEENKRYDSLVKHQAEIARRLFQLHGSIRELERSPGSHGTL
jgi:methylmalonyl-CoA mutase